MKDDGFMQLVCPQCGSYVVAPFNSGTSAVAYECWNLACGWKGNHPSKAWILYSDSTYVEPVNKEQP